MTRVPGQPREVVVEARLGRGIRDLGGMYIKLAPTEAGLPDRLALLPGGVSYLIELKTATGRLRPAQQVWHRKAERIGHHVVVLRGTEDVVAFLRRLMEGASDGSEQ